ncbi:MAG: phosphatase PAP2 family protein [Deltaproteobacteria bacterium]|nr:phosphatase PAP2 family protein [Deltaproteobacteria bacterium]
MIEADANLFLFLNTLFSTPIASAFFLQITHLGNGWTQVAIVVPAMLLLSPKKLRSHLAALILASVVSGLLVSGIKVAVNRPRPPEYFAAKDIPIHTPGRLPTSRSFPSGHTQTAVVTATYLSCLYPMLSPIFILLAVLVGISRIALGVHFPLDVLAGAVIGAGFAVLAFKLNLARLRRQNKPV